MATHDSKVDTAANKAKNAETKCQTKGVENEHAREMTQNEKKKNHGSEDFTSSRPYLLHPLVFFMRGSGHTLCGATPTGAIKSGRKRLAQELPKEGEKTDMSWCITYEIYFICACTCGVCVCMSV